VGELVEAKVRLSTKDSHQLADDDAVGRFVGSVSSFRGIIVASISRTFIPSIYHATFLPNSPRKGVNYGNLKEEL
jgi:hypothetical protein